MQMNVSIQGNASGQDFEEANALVFITSVLGRDNQLSATLYIVVLFAEVPKRFYEPLAPHFETFYGRVLKCAPDPVRWNDCCASKEVGGLCIVDANESLIALMGKWIVKAMEPSSSFFQIFLRNRLLQVQPPGNRGWPPSLHWTLLAKFSTTTGSRVWNRLVQAWRSLSLQVYAIHPRNFEEVGNTQLWWTTHFLGAAFGFTEARVWELAVVGL